MCDTAPSPAGRLSPAPAHDKTRDPGIPRMGTAAGSKVVRRCRVQGRLLPPPCDALLTLTLNEDRTYDYRGMNTVH
jgi:hypothetical protein